MIIIAGYTLTEADKRDQAALDAWRKIANPPKVARRETYVKLYRTDKAENPF